MGDYSRFRKTDTDEQIVARRCWQWQDCCGGLGGIVGGARWVSDGTDGSDRNPGISTRRNVIAAADAIWVDGWFGDGQC